MVLQTESYMEHVISAASRQVYENPQDRDPLDAELRLGGETLPETDLRLSIETLPEASSLVDFSNFAQDYPEKLMPLLSGLRPEFQELFIEYYVLHKRQDFLGKTHGCIQTRIWQTLRIIEQAVGARLLLGAEPSEDSLRAILAPAGFDETPCGSLSKMISIYASTRNYAKVAEAMGVKTPAIRKIFRPIIKTLVASKNIYILAVGAYLRNLTHQVSLTKTGLSKRALARLARVKKQVFEAPPINLSPLVEIGPIDQLVGQPWYMFEISSEHRMAQIQPGLFQQLKKLFKRKAVQVFAPVTETGELTFGYVFARSNAPVRRLLKVRGIAFLATRYMDESHSEAVTISDADVQNMIANQPRLVPEKVKVGDFVEVLSGPASHYCGTVTNIHGAVKVQVNFPTGRHFIVQADPSCVKKISAPQSRVAFWGVIPDAEPVLA